MSSNFADRLSEAILSKRSQVCVGLDPRVESLPAPIIEEFRSHAAGGCGCGRKEVAEAFEAFCAPVIDAVAPYAAAVKLQLACFEQYGPPGFKAFRHLVRKAAQADLVVIADAKRGDIGISASAYSAAFIGRPTGIDGKPVRGLEIDALTINPLFGTDGVEPFLEDCRRHGKGIFVLVRTSNPSSIELQGQQLQRGGFVYEELAAMTASWGTSLLGESGYSSVGAVVGATHPEAVAHLRALLPQTVLLLPGYGAQGAGAADVAAAFDPRGLGALVTASRSIIYADNSARFAEAAAEAAQGMQEEVWQASHPR